MRRSKKRREKKSKNIEIKRKREEERKRELGLKGGGVRNDGKTNKKININKIKEGQLKIHKF